MYGYVRLTLDTEGEAIIAQYMLAQGKTNRHKAMTISIMDVMKS